MKIIYYRHNRKSVPMKLNPTKLHFCEITVVLSGSLQYILDGEKYAVNKNDIIFIPHGALRERQSIEQTDYVSFNFVSDFPDDKPTVYEKSVNNIIKNLIATCDSVRETTNNRNDERYILLFSLLLAELKQQKRDIDAIPLVNKIKALIRNNLDKHLSLTEIGEYTFFSPVYCASVFRKATGRSIIKYSLEQKIKEAEYLLLTEPADIKIIAEKVGFSNCNYFARVFKSRTGFSPSEYKKKNHYSGGLPNPDGTPSSKKSPILPN